MKRCASSVALMKRCALLITTTVITSNGAFAIEPKLNLNLYLEQLELHLQHSQISDGIPRVNFVGNDVFILWEGAGIVGKKIIEFPQVQQTCGCVCPASLNPNNFLKICHVQILLVPLLNSQVRT